MEGQQNSKSLLLLRSLLFLVAKQPSPHPCSPTLEAHPATMLKQISEIKDFLLTARRKDVWSVKVKCST
jgi:hypothetical protein